MKNNYILIIFFSLFALELSAQVRVDNTKANNEYERYAYIDAIKTYERMFERGYKSPDMLLKLANSYYFNGNLENAAKYYKELFIGDTIVTAECYYRFAQSLKSIKEYEMADEMIVKFNKESGNDLRAKLALSQKDYLSVIRKDADKTTLLKVYKATLNKDKWENVTELPFNSNDYSVAHPALSADNKTLFFASNMPGTIGQSDIFKVRINDDGTYGLPENLGDVINTEGRESFPFITENNELYFASDGHPGLGGMDIFVSKAREDGRFNEVINVGEPLNSPKDDFGLLFDTKTKIGYVTSNRDGGVGGDDIYKVKEIKPIDYPCEQFLAGSVVDAETHQFIANAKVRLFDSAYKFLRSTITNDKGLFDFGEVDCESKYYIKIEMEDYNADEISTTITGNTGKTFVELSIEKTLKKVTIGDDIAKAFGIKTIYFDLNKSDIRPDAALELSKILDVMIQNPKIKIDIRSHTDSRNTAVYNEKLSERRATSTKGWLTQNGIIPSRLSAKGYGESQLVNKCADGVLCTEEEHQANRRSEFIIISIH